MGINTANVTVYASPHAAEMLRHGMEADRQAAEELAREHWMPRCQEYLAFEDADMTGEVMLYIHDSTQAQKQFEAAIRRRDVVTLSNLLYWAAGEFLQANPDYLDRYIEMATEGDPS